MATLVLLASGASAAADIPELRRGGQVIYLGHIGTGERCAVDRALAARLRSGLRGLPIGRVLAAPTCAARATARLVFGRSAAARALGKPGSLRRLLRSAPRRGTSTVLVGSRSILSRARGLTLRPGEAWIFSRAGVPAVRVRPHGWDAFLTPSAPQRFREWDVRQETQTHPHDIWPAGDGIVWYTAQFRGAAGRLEVATGAAHEIPLGSGSAPHGVVADADGNAWITDQGLNAIVRVDRRTEAVTVFPVPVAASNPNTAVFDARGVLWFTGAGGWYGRLDPAVGRVDVWPAPRGGGAGPASGPYGIAATQSGVYFVSLVGGYLGRVDPTTGALTVLDPPTPNAGTRRVWPDSRGRLWVTESFASKLAMYDPATGAWREWLLPGVGTGDRTGHPYAVCVDAEDRVWLTDFSTNTLLRFDPNSEDWQAYRVPTSTALVRQIVEVDGVIWGAESATEKLVAFDTP